MARQLVVVFSDFAERELKLLLSSAFCEWEPSAEWVARDNADEISPARKGRSIAKDCVSFSAAVVCKMKQCGIQSQLLSISILIECYFNLLLAG